MNAKVKILTQDSGNTEYYTPQIYTLGALAVMGSINLDPASSLKANEAILADQIFTEAENGLEQDWYGNIWLNHPFGRVANPLWIKKLIEEYELEHINQACCITYASTSEKWFRPLLSFPQCFIYGRTNYILPNGKIKKGVTKGSVITYLGNEVDKFKMVFSRFGMVK